MTREAVRRMSGPGHWSLIKAIRRRSQDTEDEHRDSCDDGPFEALEASQWVEKRDNWRRMTCTNSDECGRRKQLKVGGNNSDNWVKRSDR
ncbi:hypothetical protein ANO11243_045030 [Dothideomycetidae sp. 11243]|nr:hypothetical protein ANO11243_045030 [fungal sp. No.11243]